MALYALGDMHLAFSVDKPMDRFGKVWKKHEEKLEKNCRKLIGNEDTFVITGDHCWGKNLSEAKTDLAFTQIFPEIRFCCGEITICFGMPRKLQF